MDNKNLLLVPYILIYEINLNIKYLNIYYKKCL